MIIYDHLPDKGSIFNRLKFNFLLVIPYYIQIVLDISIGNRFNPYQCQLLKMMNPIPLRMTNTSSHHSYSQLGILCSPRIQFHKYLFSIQQDASNAAPPFSTSNDASKKRKTVFSEVVNSIAVSFMSYLSILFRGQCESGLHFESYPSLRAINTLVSCFFPCFS